MVTAATRRKNAALRAIANNPKCRAAALRALPKSKRGLLSNRYLAKYKGKGPVRRGVKRKAVSRRKAPKKRKRTSYVAYKRVKRKWTKAQMLASLRNLKKARAAKKRKAVAARKRRATAARKRKGTTKKRKYVRAKRRTGRSAMNAGKRPIVVAAPRLRPLYMPRGMSRQSFNSLRKHAAVMREEAKGNWTAGRQIMSTVNKKWHAWKKDQGKGKGKGDSKVKTEGNQVVSTSTSVASGLVPPPPPPPPTGLRTPKSDPANMEPLSTVKRRQMRQRQLSTQVQIELDSPLTRKKKKRKKGQSEPREVGATTRPLTS